MAAALLLGLATIATLATFSNGQTATNSTLCAPCNKMLEFVCAKDTNGKVKTFANPCVIDLCNCMLKLAKNERVFNQTYAGKCKETETTVPECFSEENSTSSTAAGNPATEMTSSGSSGTSGSTGSSGTTGTPAPTPGGRSSNTTTEAPAGAPGLKSMLLTLALPLAALLVFL